MIIDVQEGDVVFMPLAKGFYHIAKRYVVCGKGTENTTYTTCVIDMQRVGVHAEGTITLVRSEEKLTLPLEYVLANVETNQECKGVRLMLL